MNKQSVQTDTKDSILNAAECLFAKKGYSGTSLRALTGRAKVNLAAVNYHFGSKKALLEAVIKRKITPLNYIRRIRVEEVRQLALKEGSRPDAENILYAFIEPTLRFREDEPGAKDFVTFIGRSFADPDDTVRKVFVRFIRPMFQLLLEALCDALPHLPENTVFWRLQFSMGALFHTLHICSDLNKDKLNIKELDADSLVTLIIPYLSAGMKA
jgi:AcrR family transcriptional regulator